MADADVLQPSVYDMPSFFSKDGIGGYVTSEDALMESAQKCWKGVSRKFSAQWYTLNRIEKTLELADELKKGTYREGKVREVKITYPKPRTALSITFRDRVFQRSLNDNALYPQMVKGFIYHNLACQKGKGTDEARKCFKEMLHRAFIIYGTNKFSILSCDIRHYYDNMVHAITDGIFAKRADEWTADTASKTLKHQYKGDKGYNPGSQMVQIAGISYLNGFDHYVKERLRRKLYLRYMDDFHCIGGTVDEMEDIRKKFSEYLGKIGLELHPVKTRIRSAKDGVVFLGFLFKVTKTGKVLMFRDPKRVKEIRRRLKRLTKKIKRGECEEEALLESYQCVRACMEKGSSAKLLRNMDAFVSELMKEIKDETESARNKVA